MLTELKTSSDTVKFTFAHDGQIRIKLPPTTKEEAIKKYERIASIVAEKIMPVEKTLRGKCDIFQLTMTLVSDSKKKIAHIDWSDETNIEINFF